MAAAGLKDGSETCCDVWLGDTKTGIRIFIGSEHALKIEGVFIINPLFIKIKNRIFNLALWQQKSKTPAPHFFFHLVVLVLVTCSK